MQIRNTWDWKLLRVIVQGQGVKPDVLLTVLICIVRNVLTLLYIIVFKSYATPNVRYQFRSL